MNILAKLVGNRQCAVNSTLSYVEFHINFKTASLWIQLFIELTVPSQKTEQSCICFKDVDFVFFYGLSIEFWKCSYSVVFFVFSFH